MHLYYKNELIVKYGYPFENHTVVTQDGYILEMHRIPHGSFNSKAYRPPVLVQHGIASSSADWINNNGPENSLGFLLADRGYDVWLGNERGNTWSKKHIYLDPKRDREKFWDFSYHEIGVYDLPAMIDYILNTTKTNKLMYVGHSQGTTVFFVMASERPEYNNKVKLMTALAPVAYFTHFKNTIFKFLSAYTNFISVRQNTFLQENF